MKNKKEAVRRSRSGSISKSAQASIPFIEWYENKIFRVTENTYSLVCEFDNAGYFSKTDSEKERKYNQYRAMLCELPSNIHYEEIVYSCPVDAAPYLQAVANKEPPYDNELEEAFFKVQRIFVGGVDKDHSIQKYLISLSATVEGEESPYGKLHEALIMLEGKLKNMESDIRVLAPEEVFTELYHAYNPFEKEMPVIPTDIYKRGLTVRDFIAPCGIAFEHDHIKLGDKLARVMAVSSYGNVVSDNLMYALCANGMQIYLAKHIDHIDKDSAVKQVKKQLDEALGRKGYREEKKRPIPIDLTRTIQGCEELIDAFANGEEFLRSTLYIAVFAENMEQLNNNCARVKAAALAQGTTIRVITVQTKEAFNSILPLGKDYCMLHQFLLAGEAAVMTPFSYESYFEKEGFYYGKNHYNDEPIIKNRKKDKSSHGWVFGKTGSGKGMFTKNEMGNVLFEPYCKDDEIVVIDPSGEYIPIAQAVDGNVIQFASNGDTHINPLYLSSKVIESEGFSAARAGKVSGIIALLSELKRAGGGSAGLDSTEVAIVDSAALRALDKPTPTLQTMCDEISLIDNPKSTEILAWLRRYTEGSITLFAGEDTTGADENSKMTVYALNKLPMDIQNAAMLVMLDKIDEKLRYNWKQGKWTWVYIDEAHRFFNYERNPLAAARLQRLYAEARKYGGIITSITQLPKMVIDSPDGSAMLSNSRYVAMSELDDTNIAAVTEKYSLNEEQQRLLYSAQIGQYVLWLNNSPITVDLLLPGANPRQSNALYDLYNTSFGG